MRLLFIILVLFSCKHKDTPEPKPVLSLECQRLIDDNYDSLIYPRNECRCIYIIDGYGGYTFSHKWSPYEYQRYLDSLKCGYVVVDYGAINIIRTTVIINGITLECDC